MEHIYVLTVFEASFDAYTTILHDLNVTKWREFLRWFILSNLGFGVILMGLRLTQLAKQKPASH